MLNLRINGLWTQFIEPIVEHKPFKTGGNMRGIDGKYWNYTQSRLPEPYYETYKNQHVLYTILSYATPIAWAAEIDSEVVWFMPDVRYSNTTTKQQGRIRTALMNSGVKVGII